MFRAIQDTLDILWFKVKRLLWQLKLLKFCINHRIYFDDFSYILKIYSFMLQSFINVPEDEFMTLGRVRGAKKFKHLKEVAWRLSNGDYLPQEGQCSGKYHSDWRIVDFDDKFDKMEFYNKVPMLDFETNLFNQFWDLNKKYFRNWWD